MDIEVLIGILKESIRRYGEQPLTNKRLLGVLELHNKELEQRDRDLSRIEADYNDPQY